jgi:hypothetical protein
MNRQELIAMLRGAADGLEQLDKADQVNEPKKRDQVALLSAVAHINHVDKRGASNQDMRRIAPETGYDARGVAGLYGGGYLAWNDPSSRTPDPSKGPGRWVTQEGLNYLKERGWTPTSQ